MEGWGEGDGNEVFQVIHLFQNVLVPLRNVTSVYQYCVIVLISSPLTLTMYVIY